MKITTVDTLIDEFRNGRDVWSRTTVELAVREIERLRKRIAELEAERRWIPVSERLPEEDDNYLILAFIDGIGEYYSVAQYIEGFFFDEYDNKTNDVDFWYPLPKPPESEGE